jgi:hypothetical protein
MPSKEPSTSYYYQHYQFDTLIGHIQEQLHRHDFAWGEWQTTQTTQSTEDRARYNPPQLARW